MKPNFVPFHATLSKAAGTPGDAAKPAAGAPFQAMTQATCTASGPAHGEPVISVERSHDRITKIKIQCPCGNSFEFACEYAETIAAPGAAPTSLGEKATT